MIRHAPPARAASAMAEGWPALFERRAQPFDRDRTIDQPAAAEQVGGRFGHRVDRHIDPAEDRAARYISA